MLSNNMLGSSNQSNSFSTECLGTLHGSLNGISRVSYKPHGYTGRTTCQKLSAHYFWIWQTVKIGLFVAVSDTEVLLKLTVSTKIDSVAWYFTKHGARVATSQTDYSLSFNDFLDLDSIRKTLNFRSLCSYSEQIKGQGKRCIGKTCKNASKYVFAVLIKLSMLV